MDDTSALVFLLLAVGLGYTLFMAGREFASDLKAAKLEHAARAATGECARPPGGVNTGASDGAREGREAPPRREEPPRPRAWHEVLEVSPAASPDEIKTAYRHMIALYHPDRVAGLGAELRDLAEARAKEINAAYAFACGQRNLR